MRTIPLAALMFALASVPSRAQEAKPRIDDPINFLEQHHWKFFFGYDYFFPANAGAGLKRQLQGQADALVKTGGYTSSATNLNVSGADGARFGILHPFGPWDWGASVGYLIGPTMNASLSANGPPGPGGLTITRDLIFVRSLTQGHYIVPMGDRWKFLMGGGAGLALGRITRGCDDSGTQHCALGTAHRTWIGFTWEISPSFAYHLKRGDLRLGARYAEFPRFNGTDLIAPIDWNTYGLFAGVTF